MPEKFLENLYELRRRCIALIEAAENRHDLTDAASLQRHLQNIDSMIEERGGNPEA